MAENTTTLVTLDNLADHTDEIERILQQVRAYIDKQDSTKVDKVSGKGLSTNDLTTELLNKLNSLENYDDTAVRNLIKGISSRIDTLVGESASEAIDNFNEILAFLNGVSDTQTLQGLISNLKKALENQIATKANKSHTHAASDITDFSAQVKTLQAADILSAEPTETTLTHTVNGTTIDYKIGELVRVPDSESETGFKFFQLHAVENGKAIWAALGTGSGGNVDLTETVTISLGSNQSSGDSSLIGTRILIEDITNDPAAALLDTTWQGTPIIYKVTAATLYRVTFGDVEGYQTPDAVQYTAQLSSARNINATYNTCVLSVSISGLENGASAQATVAYGSKSYKVSSGGTVKVPIGTQVSVSVPTVSCHITPSSQTFTPDSTSKSISFAYKASKVKVSILSNQSSDSTISAVKATVVYGSTSVQASNGSVVYIPHDQTVTVTFPSVTGYKTPSSVTINNTSGGQAAASGTYQTEIVTVTVSADNSTSMSGRTVTINGTAHTYAGSAISQKIPFGTSYSVVCSAYDGYNTPATQTFTASQATRSVSMVYVYNPIVYSYITIDQGQSGESAMISGDVQGEAIQAIRNGSHLYLGKQTASGKQLICQLSDSDGTKYADGTAAALDGTEGDHWLRLPEFYWKRTAVNGNQTTYGFAFGGQPDSTWNKWDSRQLLGVHEAYVDSNKLYSRSGIQSNGNLTRNTFKTYARNRGTGYTCVTWEWHCMMAMLFYAWYGRTNSQAQCGKGSDSYTRTLGTKDSLGMTDTTSSNGNADNTKFWGIENWWGDKYEWIDNADVNGCAWTITNVENGSTRSAGTAASSAGWIVKTMLSENMDLIPTSTGGSDTTYFCDYYYCDSGVRLVARSCSGADAVGGVACVDSSSGSSGWSARVGSRLAFIGQIEEAGSVAAYKAATSIG
jgi:hypothetical protein